MNAGVARHHILLIGIDAYPKGDVLYGCVNDVDELELIFLDRLMVPAESIKKLVAPHARAARTPRIPEALPTTENIRQALESLDTDEVQPGDRVFIHYSGHGTQTFSRFSRAAREALVPVDALTGGELLFDHEVNDLLLRIAKRTTDLTVMLDCCCSAGTTRSALATRTSSIRFCSVDDSALESQPVRTRSAGFHSSLFADLDPSDPGFLVATSAQSNEWAKECADERGVRHGAFTGAFLELLKNVAPDRLKTLRWADIWPRLHARVTTSFSGQHPCLLGRSERRIFGGPFEFRDPGIPIYAQNGAYYLDAGTLVGLGVGATVAVYGDEPAIFSRLDSPEDKHARRGLLSITNATTSSAWAVALGSPPILEEGSRVRLVKPSPMDDLVVALEPFDHRLAKSLESDGGIRVVSLSDPSDYEKEAVLHWSPNGSWWLGDDVFGGDTPLVGGQTLHELMMTNALRHYALYNRPLRLVRRDPESRKWLRLRVLDAACVKMLDREELHDPALPEADPDPERRYRHELVHGQPICFSVENRSPYPLSVNVINCAASGRVEILGPAQLQIAPQRRQAFWMKGELGRPFPSSVSNGRDFNIERVVAVGTATPNVDLSYLRVKESFSETIGVRTRQVRSDKERSDKEQSNEFWTATSIGVKIIRERSEA